jgi:hypothetical protein
VEGIVGWVEKKGSILNWRMAMEDLPRLSGRDSGRRPERKTEAAERLRTAKPSLMKRDSSKGLLMKAKLSGEGSDKKIRRGCINGDQGI